MNHEVPYRAGTRLCLNFRSSLEHAVWGVSLFSREEEMSFFSSFTLLTLLSRKASLGVPIAISQPGPWICSHRWAGCACSLFVREWQMFLERKTTKHFISMLAMNCLGATSGFFGFLGFITLLYARNFPITFSQYSHWRVYHGFGG